MGSKAKRKALSGLTQSTSYTYKAYSDSACASEIASEDFVTAGPITVSNLVGGSEGNFTVGFAFGGPYKFSTAFRTGKQTGGYRLSSATVDLGANNNSPTSISAKIYTATTEETGVLVNGGNPNTLVKDLGSKTPVGGANVTWNCTDSGSGCDLSANTT